MILDVASGEQTRLDDGVPGRGALDDLHALPALGQCHQGDDRYREHVLALGHHEAHCHEYSLR
jgi:hypothetical protein